MISLISAVVAVQSGNQKALRAVRDLPPEAVSAELGSPYHIPLWSLETLVNELLATPKPKGFGVGRTRLLNAKLFRTLKTLHSVLVHLENAEDGIFLESHDVFSEMARIAQRQFPWQRGVVNAPHLYRSILLYGTGTAREYFEVNAGTSLPDFVKTATYLYAALSKNGFIDRSRDLSTIGVTPAMREAALARTAILHAEARTLTARMRRGKRHTAYSPSILRDFPILAFGDQGERLRAPIPDLIMHRYTSGLYLDVVQGGPSVWTDIGRRFETYVLEYLQAMLEPYLVTGEKEYGPKKARHRTPDILVARDTGIVAAVECKAKRMSFDARFADDPVASAALGFDELAKGMFQLWRFFSHARRGLTGDLSVDLACQGVIVTADSWLTMAAKQAEKVVAAAHILANAEGDIEDIDRRDIAFCQIDDVEYSLQNGTAESFLAACREIASGEKKWFMLSVASSANRDILREYPFKHRIPELLPWLDDPSRPSG
ncbi:hypothetical protein C5748_13140 [Phyllobacterium phragmitis]|uniref:Uncharacterized protein n=1 Tax=Phyllobacterium phragmitis TaxID=2670329 RepID=A0A2S9IRI5_9HYPH|nr:hypothetical protein [Phyllobacterium phragmitis]PRD43144.1 hypothetical protein C5748_13140 [Phyllobacterium phragmitis]